MKVPNFRPHYQNGKLVKEWTPTDDEFLRANFGKLSNEEVAEHLGRSVAAVINRANTVLHISKRNYRWTPEDNLYIRKYHNTKTCAEIAADLGIEREVVRRRAIRLGVKLKRVNNIQNLRNQQDKEPAKAPSVFYDGMPLCSAMLNDDIAYFVQPESDEEGGEQ